VKKTKDKSPLLEILDIAERAGIVVRIGSIDNNINGSICEAIATIKVAVSDNRCTSKDGVDFIYNALTDHLEYLEDHFWALETENARLKSELKASRDQLTAISEEWLGVAAELAELRKERRERDGQ